MGEAKRKKARPVEVVYHHTSTLRTNLIWMSGVIALEGQSKGAVHPQLGEIQTDLTARRACKDFPPVAWFSASTVIPRCLMDMEMIFQKKDGSGTVDIDHGVDRRVLANGIALNRMAIGFPVSAGPIVPWREYYGYETEEGMELNASAREVGDDPDMWFVSEEPVDMMAATEIHISRSKSKPRLEPLPSYLNDVKAMVQRCRETEGVYIPPSWLSPEQANRLVGRLGVPVLKAQVMAEGSSQWVSRRAT